MSEKDTALLIVDMQNDFVLEGAPFRVKEALGVIGNIKKVLQVFRDKKFPVFHIVRSHRKDGSDVEITRREKFAKTPYTVEGTKGAKIIDDLKPLEDEYIVKKIRMSGFFNTDLDSILRRLGIRNVIVTGVQTPNCIRGTAMDAVAYNYNTWVVEDATAAQNPDIHRANILDLKNAGVAIIKHSQVKDLLK